MNTIRSSVSPEEGLFELSLLNAEKQDADFEDVVIEGMRRGIPPEILTRLKVSDQQNPSIPDAIHH